MELKLGYKRTGVGVIPDDWEPSKIGDFSFVTKLAGFEYTLYFDYSKTGPIIAVRALNIKGGALDLSEVHTIPAKTSDDLPRSKLAKGDLVISYVGTVGRVAVIPKDNCFHLAPNVAKICVKRDQVDPIYLAQFLNSFNGQRLILGAAASTTQAALSMGNLREIAFPRPPIAEQRAIATILSDVDALLDGLTRLIAKKRDLKQATMQQLLTGQTRLPGFSGDWEVKRFGDVADIDPENLSASTDPQYGFQYVALEDVDRGMLVGCSEQTFSTAPSRARRRLRIGDILVSTVRPSLKSHLLFSEPQGVWVCSTGFSVVRCRLTSAIPAYVYAHLFADEVNRQIDTLLTGSNYPAINSGDVRALKVALPPVAEQTAIATVLSDMDTELAALDARLTKTRALKQAMMQELLTGKTRLLAPEDVHG